MVQKPDLVRSEIAKQVKCCGDTPVRHTGVGGFNSPLLLQTVHASTSPGSRRAVRLRIHGIRTRAPHPFSLARFISVGLHATLLSTEGISLRSWPKASCPPHSSVRTCFQALCAAGHRRAPFVSRTLHRDGPTRNELSREHQPRKLAKSLVPIALERADRFCLSSSAGSSGCFVSSRSPVRSRREAPRVLTFLMRAWPNG